MNLYCRRHQINHYIIFLYIFSSGLGYEKVVLDILISGILKKSKKNIKSHQSAVIINAGQEAVDRDGKEAELEGLGLAP